MSTTKRKLRIKRKKYSLGSGKATGPLPYRLLGIVVLLAIFGLAMIFNVSGLSALNDFGNKFYYVQEQIQWLGVGAIVLISAMLVDYRILRFWSVPFLGVTLLFLIAVFLPGIGIHASGASRWINLGFFTFQPSELAKLTVIIYLATWFSNKDTKKLSSFLLILALIIGPVILQPDLGTSVVLVAISIVMYYFAGGPLWHFAMLVPGIGLAIGGLAVSAPYRLQRVMTFLNNASDPQGASYHVRQILIAIGSGGLFGVGIGKSRQKYAYLPEVTTDSIFAVIGEEFGLFGASIIMALLFFLILTAFQIASRASDEFGRLLGGGIAFALALQIIINLSAMVSLIPLTGIPLPFISYGGSNLIISCAMIGILASIARRRTL